jgi:hypothetical protein
MRNRFGGSRVGSHGATPRGQRDGQRRSCGICPNNRSPHGVLASATLAPRKNTEQETKANRNRQGGEWVLPNGLFHLVCGLHRLVLGGTAKRRSQAFEVRLDFRNLLSKFVGVRNGTALRRARSIDSRHMGFTFPLELEWSGKGREITESIA